MEKLYGKFIEELRQEKEDNLALIGYLEAIRYVATIDADNINKGEINDQIGVIVNFVEHNSYYNRELREVIGFKTVECDELSDGDYYYYLADQQSKALVFYTRYWNFLNHCEKPVLSESLVNILKSFGEVISETGVSVGDIDLCKSAIKFFKTYYNKLIEQPVIPDDPSNSPSNIKNIIKQYEDYNNIISLLKHPEKHIEHKKYFMFNNVLKELKFNGASHEFLWNWNVNEKTLFRSGTLAPKKVKFNVNNGLVTFVNSSYEKEAFTKVMISDCIGHMNDPDESNLHSFSEVGLISIYKYLTFPSKPEDNGTTQFNILKEASLNCIFEKASDEYNPISFQKFLAKPVDEKTGDSMNFNNTYHEIIEIILKEVVADKYKQFREDLYNQRGFIVEIYPDAKAFEDTNDKGTVRYLKSEKLPKYLESLMINEKPDLKTVGDDKEVMTSGTFYKEKRTYDEVTFDEFTFAKADKGTLFSLNLTKADIIYLLLKIYKKKHSLDDEVTEFINKDDLEISEIEKADQDDLENIEYKIFYNYQEKGKKEPTPLLFISGKKNKEDFDEAEILKDFLVSKNDEYNKILTPENPQEHPQSDFILGTLDLSTETFKLLSYYYQYKPGHSDFDNEITILKEIIFKSKIKK